MSKLIGTNPDQVPVNGLLGSLAFEDATSVNVGNIQAINETITGGFYQTFSANAVNSTATLTIAQILSGIVTTTSASAVALTLPTGTLTDAGVMPNLAVGMSVRWSVINLGSASGAITMTAGTAHTIVGNPVVAIATSAQLLTLKIAINTYVTYRL